MKKWLLIFLMGCVFSMYIFPFAFTFFPIGNTKIYIAVLGLLLWIVGMIQGRSSLVSKSMIKLSAWAMGVSVISMLSLSYNNATDTAYVGYIVSMWVWVGAAYGVCFFIKSIHKKISIAIVCNYFIGVCVAQCLFALFNEYIPSFNLLINKLVIQQSQDYLELVDRMYGIGAAFDTAGTRFSCALIMIAFLLTNNMNKQSICTIYVYILSYIFISIVGNMVARTTSAGMVIGICYMLVKSNVISLQVSRGYMRVLKPLLFLVLISIPIVMALYSNPNVKPLLDFAFEGFIKMAETGSFETGSTNEMLLMWKKLPEETKTWIIGDGYFSSPHFTNPYYVGYHKWTFYMGTDIGYLRFIYYFGLVGLCCFFFFFIKCAQECISLHPKYKAIFVGILLMNFIIWAKVATDLFCVFALFLMTDNEDKVNISTT